MISPKTEEEKLKKAERKQKVKEFITDFLKAIVDLLKEYVLPLGGVVLAVFIVVVPSLIEAENTTYNTYTAEAVVYEKTFTPAHTESDLIFVPSYGTDGSMSYSYIPTTKHVPDKYVIKISYNGYTLTLNGENAYNNYEKGDIVPVIVTETLVKDRVKRGKIELAGEELDNGD